MPVSAVRSPGSTVVRISARLFEPVDIAALVYFRVTFAAFLLIEIWRYFDHGWIHRYFIEPSLFFSYPGFSWVRPWAGDGMYVHGLVLGLLALGMLVGYRHRLCSTLFFLGYTYVFLLDQTNYQNHLYLISLLSFLSICLPLNRSLSLDCTRRPEMHSETAPAWCLWLLRAQIGIVYVYGGIAKLNGDWLRGEPMRMWLARRTDLPLIGPLLDAPWVPWAFSYGGLLLDLLAVPCLMWKPTRSLAVLALVTFHLMNATLFSIGIFPWLMLAFIPLFFAPDWTRLGTRPLERHAPGNAGPYWSKDPRDHRVLVALLGTYLTLQLLIPFRHVLYPGNVNWTEEGHRFSWHMKLRDKECDASFTVTMPATGNSILIKPQSYLTSRQQRKMVSRPDMIRRFCRHLADGYRFRGVDGVEVRARISASLNGRAFQALVDPGVDLGSEPYSIFPATWIVPLREPLEP
jgi:vitamin K-dependent gamma-carboxylase